MTAKYLFVCWTVLALPSCVTNSTTAEPLGLGRLVDRTEIALWDIDVRADGTGLPAGEGTVAQGEKVYSQHCLGCHGENGVGGINDQLVGRMVDDEFPFGRDPAATKTIGNYWPYASTLFDYIRRAMPYTQAGVLSDNEVYSVTAYLLHLNQLLDADLSLDAQRLRSIKMPARDRFVIDDRTATEVFSEAPAGEPK